MKKILSTSRLAFPFVAIIAGIASCHTGPIQKIGLGPNDTPYVLQNNILYKCQKNGSTLNCEKARIDVDDNYYQKDGFYKN